MAGLLPTRLFDVSGEKLVEGKNLPPDTKYYALSHVWGTSPKSTDVPTIPWKVPAAQEKVNFILKACVANKFNYIWLDIFCIRQGDDDAAKLDQGREMPKMQQYYTKCVAGFVIGDAYDSFAARWLKVDTLLNIWNKDRDGTKPETLHDIWQGLGDIDDVVGGSKGDRWFWRLWTLQETVLPPRLLTSAGTVMQVYDFCNLIDWTYTALAKNILNRNGPAVYDWLHPGQGVVNDKGWWMLSRGLLLAQLLGHNLDPLQALIVTAYRQVNPKYPKDALFAAYGLIDDKWHVEDNPTYTLQTVWKLTVTKYIEKSDIAPLLSMAVTTGNEMTWAAGRTEYIGSVVAKAGQWINNTANMDGFKLKLSVPGVSKINRIPNYTKVYGDGSGELVTLLGHLRDLEKANYKISSITALLIRAIRQARFDCKDQDTLETLIHIIEDHGVPQTNAISSGLRAVFNGWDRILVTTESKEVFLAWFPLKDLKKLDDGNCSLLWSVPDSNEWAAIVEGELTSCKKVGIAFTNNFKPAPKTPQQVILL